MKWINRFFNLFKPKPKVLDAFDVARQFNPNHKYKLYVNELGKLTYHDKNFHTEVIGIIEWNIELKKDLQIDPGTIITDLSLKRSPHDV